MTWLLLGLGLLAVIVLLGRTGAPTDRSGAVGPSAAAHRAVAPGPRSSTTLRRALDPDDPDGAFMDGYVSGRYTERRQADRSRTDQGRGAVAAVGASGLSDSDESDGWGVDGDYAGLDDWTHPDLDSSADDGDDW